MIKKVVGTIVFIVGSVFVINYYHGLTDLLIVGIASFAVIGAWFWTYK